VDPAFQGTQQWYSQMATSLPPKDEPWYHVLVHGADHTTYVAEQNLAPHSGKEFIDHPLLPNFFNGFSCGVYSPINKQ
jgi:heat shock protein HspQ